MFADKAVWATATNPGKIEYGESENAQLLADGTMGAITSSRVRHLYFLHAVYQPNKPLSFPPAFPCRYGAGGEGTEPMLCNLHAWTNGVDIRPMCMTWGLKLSKAL
jgi:hypothetical protein